MAKKDNTKNQAPKKKSKLWLVLLIIFGAILLIIISGILFIDSKLSVDTKDAMLYPNGTAYITRGTQTLSANAPFELEEKDIVSTKDSGAQIIFYDSVYMTLAENTKVSLEDMNKDDIIVMQQEGYTYNKLTGLFDVKGFTVKTSDSAASAHGTGFEVYRVEGKSIVIVSDGTVVFNSGNESVNLTSLQKAEGNGVRIEQSELTAEEKNKIIASLEGSKQELIQRRFDVSMQFIADNQDLVNQAEERYNVSVTPEKVREFYDKVDKGWYDLERLKGQVEETAPMINTEILDYVYDLTLQIKKQDALISGLKAQ